MLRYVFTKNIHMSLEINWNIVKHLKKGFLPLLHFLCACTHIRSDYSNYLIAPIYQSFSHINTHSDGFHSFQISGNPFGDLCFSKHVLPILRSCHNPNFYQHVTTKVLSKLIFWTGTTAADKARQDAWPGTKTHAYRLHIHTKSSHKLMSQQKPGGDYVLKD